MKYSDEQIRRANETDLVSFLKSRGEKLEKSGREYRWVGQHSSMTIRGNEWYWHKEQRGGGPLDLMMKVCNYGFR
jgi:hypothetical protein